MSKSELHLHPLEKPRPETDSHHCKVFLKGLKSEGANPASLASHLPVSKTTEYADGRVIYASTHPSESIYLVIQGMVEISRPFEGSRGAVLEIIRPDGVFGESAFLPKTDGVERATALGSVTLMSWTIAEMEELIRNRPKLAVALLGFFARRNEELNRRIESLSLDTLERRLALALIVLSERLGTSQGHGTVRMPPLNLDLLSRFVGASPEIVTQYMNGFCERGYVSHSRAGISFSRAYFQRLASNTARRSRSGRCSHI